MPTTEMEPISTDPEVETKEYRIRIGVTVRAYAEETFEATSWEEAVQKASEYDPDDFWYSYSRDDGREGDEIAYLREADDDMSDDHEIELRTDGEPFSWTSVEIVKKLADLPEGDFTAEKLGKIATIIQEARAACRREA